MVILTVSKHGTMKNIPGPTVPLRLTRPKRKSTARSYSWTIRTQKMREIGKVMTMRKIEMNQVNPVTHPVAQPPSSASSEEKGQIRPFYGLLVLFGSLSLFTIFVKLGGGQKTFYGIEEFNLRFNIT